MKKKKKRIRSKHLIKKLKGKVTITTYKGRPIPVTHVDIHIIQNMLVGLAVDLQFMGHTDMCNELLDIVDKLQDHV